jgi:hypothetical protein
MMNKPLHNKILYTLIIGSALGSYPSSSYSMGDLDPNNALKWAAITFCTVAAAISAPFSIKYYFSGKQAVVQKDHETIDKEIILTQKRTDLKKEETLQQQNRFADDEQARKEKFEHEKLMQKQKFEHENQQRREVLQQAALERKRNAQNAAFSLAKHYSTSDISPLLTAMGPVYQHYLCYEKSTKDLELALKILPDLDEKDRDLFDKTTLTTIKDVRRTLIENHGKQITLEQEESEKALEEKRKRAASVIIIEAKAQQEVSAAQAIESMKNQQERSERAQIKLDEQKFEIVRQVRDESMGSIKKAHQTHENTMNNMCDANYKGWESTRNDLRSIREDQHIIREDQRSIREKINDNSTKLTSIDSTAHGIKNTVNDIKTNMATQMMHLKEIEKKLAESHSWTAKILSCIDTGDSKSTIQSKINYLYTHKHAKLNRPPAQNPDA